jgi:hypothetical protein
MNDELEMKCVDGDGTIIYEGKIKPGKELVKLSKKISKKYS